jgi:hypothetical protein
LGNRKKNIVTDRYLAILLMLAFWINSKAFAGFGNLAIFGKWIQVD